MKKQVISLLMAAIMVVLSCTGKTSKDVGYVDRNDTLMLDVNDDSVYSNPDVSPQPIDGALSVMDFFHDKLYESPYTTGESGFIVIQMVVEKDGTPLHFEVFGDSTAPLLDYEAISKAKDVPKFIPAQKDGKVVRSTFASAVRYRPRTKNEKPNRQKKSLNDCVHEPCSHALNDRGYRDGLTGTDD